MTDRIEKGGLLIARALYDFINDEALPGTGVDQGHFWSAFDAIVNDLTPRNRALLAERDALQAKIDAWHKSNTQRPIDMAAYRAFLTEIGYLVPEQGDCAISTANVDPDISTIAGPQLPNTCSNSTTGLQTASRLWQPGRFRPAMPPSKSLSRLV